MRGAAIVPIPLYSCHARPVNGYERLYLSALLSCTGCCARRSDDTDARVGYGQEKTYSVPVASGPPREGRMDQPRLEDVGIAPLAAMGAADAWRLVATRTLGASVSFRRQSRFLLVLVR